MIACSRLSMCECCAPSLPEREVRHAQRRKPRDAGLLSDQPGGACHRAQRPGDGRRDVRDVRGRATGKSRLRGVRHVRIHRGDGVGRNDRILSRDRYSLAPGQRRRHRPRVEPVELLSAAGTFLAAVAALISVCAIVLDEAPHRAWELVIGSWWLVGPPMQISARSIAPLRPAREGYPPPPPPPPPPHPLFPHHPTS